MNVPFSAMGAHYKYTLLQLICVQLAAMQPYFPTIILEYLSASFGLDCYSLKLKSFSAVPCVAFVQILLSLLCACYLSEFM